MPVTPETPFRRDGRAIYLLKEVEVRRMLDDANLTLSEAAALLGVSRSYFSQLLAKKRPLSPKVRRKLLVAPRFKDLLAEGLWERCENTP